MQIGAIYYMKHHCIPHLKYEVFNESVWNTNFAHRTSYLPVME